MGELLSFGLTILASIVLLGLSGFFSGSETALFSLSRTLVRRMERGSFSERAASRLLKTPQRLLSTLLVGNMFVNILLTSLLATIMARVVPRNGGLASVITIAVVWPLLMIFGELTPKTLAYNHAPVFARLAALPLLTVAWLTAPVRWLVRLAAQGVLTLLGQSDGPQWDVVTPDEVLAMLEVAEKNGTANSNERELVTHILRLGSIQAREIMVPRTEVVGIRDDATLAEAYAKARTRRHSRLPVYHDDLDDIWGILSMVDFPRWRDSEWMHKPLAQFRAKLEEARAASDSSVELPVYPVLLVPETVKVERLLNQMRESRAQIVVLVGEYGGTEGILTLNDILEEVVGQLTPSEKDDNLLMVGADGDLLVDGRISLRELAEQTGLPLVPNGSDTLGGYVMEHLGRLPRTGDVVQGPGCRLEVLRMAGRRVGTIRIFRTSGETDQALEGEST